MTSTAPDILMRIRADVQPALRAAIESLEDERIRLICGYHLGWLDAAGNEVDSGGGKAMRPALAVLSAEAAGGAAADGVPAAVAVELVHNFSLLHDDIMDRDVERRHRPTGWVVFGDGQAILAGNAMLAAAIDVLVQSGPGGRRSVPCLLAAVQRLIAGQSEDLALEQAPDVDLDTVLHMEAGKTAALLSCSSSIGALAVGAPGHTVNALAGYGHELGMAFQLVDDILGIVGDAGITGKSSSSDVRAGKRSVPIVAALSAGNDHSTRLRDKLAGGPPTTQDDVTEITKMIDEAGGLDWAAAEAARRLAKALEWLEVAAVPAAVAAQLADLAHYVVGRDR